MDVLRHWLVLGHPAGDHIAWDERDAETKRQYGYRVEGPFVHPDTYQGAVERGRAEMLRDVLKVLERWDEHHGHGKPDPVEYVRRRLGGQ